MTTPVIFRKWRASQFYPRDVIALLPTIPAEYAPSQLITVYQHIGQHGAGDYWVCMSKSTPATPAEYRDLLTELERLGYDDLQIVKRRSPAHRDAFKRAQQEAR